MAGSGGGLSSTSMMGSGSPLLMMEELVDEQRPNQTDELERGAIQ